MGKVREALLVQDNVWRSCVFVGILFKQNIFFCNVVVPNPNILCVKHNGNIFEDFYAAVVHAVVVCSELLHHLLRLLEFILNFSIHSKLKISKIIFKGPRG